MSTQEVLEDLDRIVAEREGSGNRGRVKRNGKTRTDQQQCKVTPLFIASTTNFNVWETDPKSITLYHMQGM
jgi:hypothetical protein